MYSISKIEKALENVDNPYKFGLSPEMDAILFFISQETNVDPEVISKILTLHFGIYLCEIDSIDQ